MQAYVEALKKEVEYWGGIYGKRGKNHTMATIYYGGGTPSVLPALYIEEIQQTIASQFTVDENAEVTIECNPGTIEEEKLRRYRSYGCNRLSIGLQSAKDEELAMLGRIHTYRDFCAGFEAARKVGFQNISVDIMSALPGQTLASYEETLRKVVEFHPEHISSYSLIVEEGTDFYRRYCEGSLVLPEEEEERLMYVRTKEYLEEWGYERYEISNYSKPGYRSRHNSSYWTGADYLGLGLGASSYIEGIRFKNPTEMEVYKSRIYTGDYRKDYTEVEVLTEEMKIEEYIFLGLRRKEGISGREFQEHFHMDFGKKYGEVLKQMEEDGLMYCEGDRIALTEKGVDVSNYVFEKFF